LTKESALSKRADDFFRDFPELRDLAQRKVFVGVSAVSGSLGNKDAPFKVSLSWEDEPGLLGGESWVQGRLSLKSGGSAASGHNNVKIIT
jgi:hypothetical protein